MNPAERAQSPKSESGRRLVCGVTKKLGPCGKVTVFGVLQAGAHLVSGISAEGSGYGSRPLKVFMQFVQS